MKFRSNNSVTVHVPDLKKAEAFYSGVLGFRLLAKTPARLEYDTGRLVFLVHKADEILPPIPSFTVINAPSARSHLEQGGCEIIEDRGRSLSFKDPFGLRFDITED